jgi:hypothetical protein
MRLTIPPELGPVAEVLDELRRRVDAAVTAIAAERQRTGKRVYGRRAVLRQPWWDRPTSLEPRRNLRPRVAARNAWARIEALLQLSAASCHAWHDSKRPLTIRNLLKARRRSLMRLNTETEWSNSGAGLPRRQGRRFMEDGNGAVITVHGWYSRGARWRGRRRCQEHDRRLCREA